VSVDVEELVRLLGDSEAFSEIDVDALREIAAKCSIFSLPSGQTLVEQGDEGDSMFVVLEGRLSVTIGGQDGNTGRLAELEAGSIVGEVAAVAGGRRSATVRAETDARLAALGRDGFNGLLAAQPKAAAALSRITARRLREQQLAVHIANVFPGLDRDGILALAQRVEWVTLLAGDTLFDEGDAGDSAYMVVSGRLIARVRRPDGGQETVGEVACGEFVGEYALINEQPRGATVIAKKDTDLARIPNEVFSELIATRSDILLELTRTIIRRSESSYVQMERRRDATRSIAVVYLDERVVDDSFCEELSKQLTTHGETIHLTSERIDSILGKNGIAESRADDPAHIRLLQWLSQVESSHRFVVYQADTTYTQWTERAIRHADEVVFVADAAGDPGRRALEIKPGEMRENSHQRASLVLLHNHDTDQPRATARWLVERDVDAVYHVRRRTPGDAARLGRILAGRALGLVLGGGGARGFAHLGVLRALEELGIAIDMIGGTSIGAPIAHLPAQNRDAAECLAVIEAGFDSLFDYTLPVASLLAGNRITHTIETYAKGWDIEDLWLPYYCVSTNATTAREMHHRRGDLARAVRASVSIPGVLPPVPEENELLVDGGVMNNLPIDVMRKINPTGPIIAIDVTPQRGPSAKSDYGLSVSGWRIAASRINPRRRVMKVPPVALTILRSMLVGADRSRSEQLSAKLADLYMNIDIAGVGLLDFHRVSEVAAMGYEQSLEALREWSEQA
jgi:predicted acylesterase/phospholipase RssA/CRP-like cAMP-binding protein